MSSDETLATDGSDAAGGLPAARWTWRVMPRASAPRRPRLQPCASWSASCWRAAAKACSRKLALRHVITRLTDEGLVIEFFALPGAPCSARTMPVPMPVTTELVAMVADSAQLVTNPIAVTAHLPAAPVVATRGPWWDLSVARADMTRILLEASGLEALRVHRVTGFADRSPADPDNPASERNDRIEIIFLRQTG